MTDSDAEHIRPVDWKVLHSALLRLRQTRGAVDAEEGGLLLAALRSKVHRQLGYASFHEYIERVLGYGPRWTQERLRVAEALERLPQLAGALREGELPWSAVRELTRVATSENEAEWLELAKQRPVRELARLVSGHAPGDRPDDPKDPALRRHVLRFEVSGEVLATFREAVGQLKRQTGGALSDEEALLLMARHTLGVGAEAGRATYQIAVTVCEDCGRGWQHGRGERVELSPEALAMAACDAVHIGKIESVSNAPGGAHATRPEHVSAPTTDSPEHVSAPTTDSPEHVGTPNANSGEHVGTPTADSPEHADADEGPQPKASVIRNRASQSIPPAIRRRVLHRDGHACTVPGCRNSIHLDLHHVTPRAEGGKHDPNLLVCMCSVHHAQAHRGRLLITGNAAEGFVFRHADGSPYGEPAVSPARIELFHKAYLALRTEGFRETETRRALERVRRDSSKQPESSIDIATILRRAFALLVA